MSGLTVSGSPRIGAMVWQSFTAMTPAERTRVTAMYGAIAGLHLLGFFILFAFVVPSHYKGLGIGVAILAYTLGLRHAFDADHISAVDNTTRKVLGERQGTGEPRPFGFGFFFSLGHSSVVVAIGFASRKGPSFPQYRAAARHWSVSEVSSARSCPRRSCS
jgi:high-affinity nickel permease